MAATSGWPKTPGEASGASELCWGPGLVPAGLEDAPPSRGGRYQGKCPPLDSQTTEALSRFASGGD